MNRRQKIIVSVTGIFLVLLLLVGLTYAYFLTKITGNNNEKSISVTTANLQLVYGNDDGNVIGNGELIVPNTTFEPKTFTVKNEGNATTDYVVVIENATSTFKNNDFVYTLTCTSDGETCTGVDTETTYPINGGVLVANTIEVGKTHTYSFTLKYVDTGSDQSEDMNKKLEGKLNIKNISEVNPYSNDTDSLAYNIINNAKNKTNGTELLTTPRIKVGKSLVLYKTNDATEKINDTKTGVTATQQERYFTYGTGYIVDEKTGKFSLTGVGTCQYNDGTCHEILVGKYIVSDYAIYSSYKTDKKRTTTNLDNIFKVTTAPASSSENIWIELKILSPISYNDTEKTLSVTQDDYGISYYYRGNVEDNYVNFAGMCWRIVRIEGDGSTKLILEDKDTTCNDTDTSDGVLYTGNWSDGNAYEYGYDASGLINSSLFGAFKTFQTSKLSGVLDKLKADEWCYDDTETIIDDLVRYGAYTRIEMNGNPSLKCTGTTLIKFNDGTDIYVATLTADEIVYAGEYSFRTYLATDYINEDNAKGWWSLSPAEINGGGYSDVYGYYGSGSFHTSLTVGNDSDFTSRPAITLKATTKISGGNGTQTDPYTVE